MRWIWISGLLLTGAALAGGASLRSRVERDVGGSTASSSSAYRFSGEEREEATQAAEEDLEPLSLQGEETEDWNLILVNPWNPLPSGFTVELEELRDGQSIDKRAYPDLQKMMDDMRKEGLSPLICSSYRSEERQRALYQDRISRFLQEGYSQQESESEARKWVAFPGTSEHQTGLAVDIVATDYQLLDEKQENTSEQRWLMENSYKYGWILRYPNEKSAVTGIYYEPWHYRYVGKEAAREIYERGLCLEEYLEEL